ncbi:hypothetical protein VTN00DRAFT_7316 [Thermoascus crustaceus]|uniref:uncharacterized protein n=1 Tax=Thermoascus crustaceus TaxID=5088 RepID=UPI003744252F
MLRKRPHSNGGFCLAFFTTRIIIRCLSLIRQLSIRPHWAGFLSLSLSLPPSLYLLFGHLHFSFVSYVFSCLCAAIAYAKWSLCLGNSSKTDCKLSDHVERLILVLALSPSIAVSNIFVT